jgi:hypothetical protein
MKTTNTVFVLFGVVMLIESLTLQKFLNRSEIGDAIEEGFTPTVVSPSCIRFLQYRHYCVECGETLSVKNRKQPTIQNLAVVQFEF